MLKEYVNEEIMDKIKKELDEEYEALRAKWINVVIDRDVIHNNMIADIYNDYCDIPMRNLILIINKEFPFTKNIQINPCFNEDIQYCNISWADYDTQARLNLEYIGRSCAIRDYKSADFEQEQLDEICEELMDIYESLNLDMNLYLLRCDDEIEEGSEYYSCNIEHYSKIVGV